MQGGLHHGGPWLIPSSSPPHTANAGFEFFKLVMGKAMLLVLKHLETHLASCYDAISVMLCARVNAHYQTSLAEKDIVCMGPYLENVMNLLWPAFIRIIDANTARCGGWRAYLRERRGEQRKTRRGNGVSVSRGKRGLTRRLPPASCSPPHPSCPHPVAPPQCRGCRPGKAEQGRHAATLHCAALRRVLWRAPGPQRVCPL